MDEDSAIQFPEIDIRKYPKPQKGKQELLAKAIGAGKGIEQVIDLTCGLAQDAFFFAQLGLRVLALERNEAVFHWISKEIEKAKRLYPENSALALLQIKKADAIEFLLDAKNASLILPTTALYFDPMFPQKRKTALPRKEMQVFQKLLGPDEDSTEVLRACLKTGFSRVLVKRPLKAPPILQNVQHQFLGTSIRYDLYLGAGPRS